jgi:hypothetical protein
MSAPVHERRFGPMSSPSFADRPPPDPLRLLAALDEWRRGDVTAGTVLQTFKRGGLDALLAEEGRAAPPALRDAWDAWERGRTPPAETLTRLDEAGLRPFLEAAP